MLLYSKKLALCKQFKATKISSIFCNQKKNILKIFIVRYFYIKSYSLPNDQTVYCIIVSFFEKFNNEIMVLSARHPVCSSCFKLRSNFYDSLHQMKQFTNVCDPDDIFKTRHGMD